MIPAAALLTREKSFLEGRLHGDVLEERAALRNEEQVATW